MPRRGPTISRRSRKRSAPPASTPCAGPVTGPTARCKKSASRRPGAMADFGIGEALLAATAAATTIGSAISAAGAASEGQGQAAALQTNAQIQQQNAQIATAQTERTLGQIAASYGASGVDVTRGSPLQVMADQAATGELTRQLDLYRGAVAATGNLNQAQLYRIEAQQAQQAGQIRAGATILTGLGATARAAAPLFGSSAVNQDFSGRVSY